MTTEEKRLIVISEGGAHTIDYLHRNGVYPGAIVMTATKYKEIIPYLSKNDEVLVLIKGLTDFTMEEIYVLLDDIEETRDRLHAVTILSNIDLGKINKSYYYYTGDLFYGQVYESFNGKLTLIEEEDSEDKKKKGKQKKSKGSKDAENVAEVPSINSVIARYLVYNKRDVKFTVYGSESKGYENSDALDGLAEKIVKVDLFDTQK